MKVKALARSEDFSRARSGDIYKVQRNLDPVLHPFERAREYTRTLNAVKLERLFARPFVAALSGHIEGVYCLAKHPTSLSTLFSASSDGTIKLWSLSSRVNEWSVKAHKSFVRGLCTVPYSDRFFSVGDDKVVKCWSTDTTTSSTEPLNTYIHTHAFTGIDHHRSAPIFATSSQQIDLWHHDRAEPTTTLSWGSETITTVKFNQTETSILASCGSDRTIVLYDTRTSKPLSKVVLAMRSNALAWNPMEAFNFTVANEDHNCYTFDMRKLDIALNVSKDHVSAVLDIDYSPTGQEFVTGGYDRTIRIFSAREGRSREVYHTKRMQRIFCVKYSMDSKFIASGSDDGNVRLWKSNASEHIGTMNNRQRDARIYNDSLKERYKHLPEIRRITNSRRIPKAISNAASTKRIMETSIKQKEENKRKHSKPGAVPFKVERKKNVVKVEK